MVQATNHKSELIGYLQMRIKQTESYISSEKLAGNEPKELAEKAAQSELYGVLKFIEELGL